MSATDTHFLIWHGWRIPLPAEWNPVKLDGDWNKGSALLADLFAPRLHVRWQRAPRRFDPGVWADRAMRAEVGQLMADKSLNFTPPAGDWSVGKLFEEPDPPGRDVWVGHSRASDRLLELSYPTKAADGLLRRRVLPGLGDTSPADAQRWSVFDLTCRTPPGFRLRSQRLNAGDLALTFVATRGREQFTVRQIGPAKLALDRQPADVWLGRHQQIWKQMYRLRGDFEPTPDGITRTVRRRRRFFFAWWAGRERVGLLSHDRNRDRLVLVDAATRERAVEVAATVGHNERERSLGPIRLSG